MKILHFDFISQIFIVTIHWEEGGGVGVPLIFT